jgi:alpha-galactosidase
MCSRSVPFWRSDTNCFAGNAVWSQMHSVALGQYVPLSTACVWEATRNSVRSASTSGLLCQFAYQDAKFPLEEVKSFVAEANANRKYWYGDMYPLTGCGTEQDQFMAFQMHRPDLGAGVVCAFRRAECPLRGIVAEIKGIEADKTYKVEMTDEAGNKKSWEIPGAELSEGLELRVTKPGESTVVTYQRIQ